MNTNLFLCNESFRGSSATTLNDLKSAIEDLLDTWNLARTNSDRVLRNASIYSEVIYQGNQTIEVLYGSILPQDHKKALIKVLDHSQATSLSGQDQVDILDNHSDTEIYGLLLLYETQVTQVNEQYIINNYSDWYLFHRTFLGIYPVSESHFYKECKKYFPELFFHDRVEASLSTLENSLLSFSKNIVHHLVQLNDHYSTYHIAGNRVESLRCFSSACSIEVTPEGNVSRKPFFTFQFISQERTVVDVCCEPHTKLTRSDNPGDAHYYTNRIYFHEGNASIQNGKVLIGHIGGHL